MARLVEQMAGRGVVLAILVLRLGSRIELLDWLVGIPNCLVECLAGFVVPVAVIAGSPAELPDVLVGSEGRVTGFDGHLAGFDGKLAALDLNLAGFDEDLAGLDRFLADLEELPAEIHTGKGELRAGLRMQMIEFLDGSQDTKHRFAVLLDGLDGFLVGFVGPLSRLVGLLGRLVGLLCRLVE